MKGITSDRDTHQGAAECAVRPDVGAGCQICACFNFNHRVRSGTRQRPGSAMCSINMRRKPHPRIMRLVIVLAEDFLTRSKRDIDSLGKAMAGICGVIELSPPPVQKRRCFFLLP